MEQYLFQVFSVVLNMVLLYAFRKYTERQSQVDKKQKAIEQGLQSLLRDRIIQTCMTYTKKDVVPMDELDNVTHIYHAYKDLGGNGAVEAIYNRFLTLSGIVEKRL